tara:strand:- start:45 stop:1148 length:1104 start_codon:yes stop_codon:yes gene_type:complete
MNDLINSLPENHRILVTGGAGFIGSACIRKLLLNTDAKIFNLDKINYCSDLKSIYDLNNKIGDKLERNYRLLKIDLANPVLTDQAIKESDPDLIINFAAESHVDRSIENPGSFIHSNIVGTYNLLQSSLNHYNYLSGNRKNSFRFHHISTDEVFGSLGENGKFNEGTKYDPRSPYSASKASSDHLVNAWSSTFGLPISITNCSNNYGPWQFPEKLIPLVILKALSNKEIPIYGDGKNIRDWLYVDDHIDAILKVAIKGKEGKKYCIGGNSELTNIEVVSKICSILNEYYPQKERHQNLITYVADRSGHDRRYAIDASLIKNELGWKATYCFDTGLRKTVKWYIENLNWCKYIQEKSGYKGERIAGKR